MKTKFIEVTQPEHLNWGKFMLARFDAEEWARRSALAEGSLLRGRGWGPEHLLIVDLQTGEGAVFRQGGSARNDLNKRKIWVCPMFEPFLEWLYKQNTDDLDALPGYVEIAAPSETAGYRRPGAPTPT